MSETLKTPTIQEIEDSKARGEQSAFNKGPNGELLDEGYTTNDLGKVVWVGEGPEPDVKTSEKTSSQPSANEKLFNKLVEDKLYSKDYEEFQQQFSSPSAKLNLYKKMKEDKLYSKSAGDFMNLFFPIKDEETPEVKEDQSQDVDVKGEENTASESVDTILPLYYEKPKTAEEVQQSLFNIKETTDNTDEIVINRSVEEYFENPLKDFDKWLETTGKQTQVKKGTAKQGYYYEGVPLSDSERQGYLKEYLGEKQYNEYVEWDKGDGTQNLPIGSEDFDGVLNSQITERTKEKQQRYVDDMSIIGNSQLQQDALVLMPDIFGGARNLQTEVHSEDDAKEWDELYYPNGDNPLRGFKQRRAKGRDGEWKLFTPPMGKAGSLDASNKNYEKNLKLQGNYLTNSFNAYKNDVKGYDKKLADWNTNQT